MQKLFSWGRLEEIASLICGGILQISMAFTCMFLIKLDQIEAKRIEVKTRRHFF